MIWQGKPSFPDLFSFNYNIESILFLKKLQEDKNEIKLWLTSLSSSLYLSLSLFLSLSNHRSKLKTRLKKISFEHQKNVQIQLFLASRVQSNPKPVASISNFWRQILKIPKKNKSFRFWWNVKKNFSNQKFLSK